MPTRVGRLCPICGCEDAEDKVIDVPVTVKDNTLIVSVRAFVCVECGDYSVDGENADKLHAAHERLVNNNTHDLVAVGKVYKQA